MAREIQEAARPASPLESKAARDQNRERLLTPRDAADVLRLSPSWLAKARMRGDGPPFLKVGRSVRYAEGALPKWMTSRTRLSTSER
jgi:predicted DNA-binding transcriptional regulator AlpA